MAIKVSAYSGGERRHVRSYPRLMIHRDTLAVALVQRDGTGIYLTGGTLGDDPVGVSFRSDASGHLGHWGDFTGSVTITNAD